MNVLREYVAKLTDAEKVELIDGFTRLESEGQLGDHPLRQHAKNIITEIGIDYASVTLIMRDLTMECYRYFTNKYFKEHGL